jgi:hypothetical protein
MLATRPSGDLLIHEIRGVLATDAPHLLLHCSPHRMPSRYAVNSTPDAACRTSLTLVTLPGTYLSFSPTESPLLHATSSGSSEMPESPNRKRKCTASEDPSLNLQAESSCLALRLRSARHHGSGLHVGDPALLALLREPRTYELQNLDCGRNGVALPFTCLSPNSWPPSRAAINGPLPLSPYHSD